MENRATNDELKDMISIKKNGNNEKLMNMLGKQPARFEYMDGLKDIFNDKPNERDIQMGSHAVMLVDCFNYGIIVGKRMERARKKHELTSTDIKNNILRFSKKLPSDEYIQLIKSLEDGLGKIRKRGA